MLSTERRPNTTPLSENGLSPEQQALVTDYLEKWRTPLTFVFHKYSRRTNRLKRFGIEEDELESVCNLSLVMAARSYDPRRGCTFATWANNGLRFAILKIEHDLQLVMERPKMISGDVEHRDMSYSAKDGRTRTLLNMVPDKSDEDHVEDPRMDALRKELSAMDKRNYEIVNEYYGLNGQIPKRLKDLGEERGISRQRVQQIIANARIRLRSKLRK